MGLLTRNEVFQSSEQLDYIEDWMEPRHGGWESEAVCIPANSSCHCEGSEIVMGKFLRGTGGTDITHVQVYSVRANLECCGGYTVTWADRRENQSMNN